MRIAAATAVVLLSAIPATAGAIIPPPPTVAGSHTDTKAFVGLNWTFGGTGAGPEAVIGVARVKTETDGDARGAKLSVHLPVRGGLSFGKVKLVGMTGESDRLAEAGLGWGAGEVFGTAGLWAPHLNLGVDFGLSGFSGNVGLNTLDEWEAPTVITVIPQPPV